jgi:hypothetical protein
VHRLSLLFIPDINFNGTLRLDFADSCPIPQTAGTPRDGSKCGVGKECGGYGGFGGNHGNVSPTSTLSSYSHHFVNIPSAPVLNIIRHTRSTRPAFRIHGDHPKPACRCCAGETDVE